MLLAEGASATQVEIFKAASLGRLGRQDEARQVWSDLKVMDAAFAENPRREIHRLIVNNETIDAVIVGLAKAGLQIESHEEGTPTRD